MGNLCDCICPSAENLGPTQKTPLLADGNKPVTSQPANPKSARVHNPNTEDEFMTSLELVTPIELGTVTTVPTLDKSFQDHAKLYNDLYSSFVDLRKCLHQFKTYFEHDTGGIPVLSECLILLNKRCGAAKLRGSRTKNCIQIMYDRKTVSKCCEGQPEDVIDTLELYNTCNKHVKSVMDKSSQVKSSISLILEEEQKLKREVTKADPDGKQGPEPLRVTSKNFSKLHKLPDFIETIHKYTSHTFNEIVNGSKVLFSDDV